MVVEGARRVALVRISYGYVISTTRILLQSPAAPANEPFASRELSPAQSLGSAHSCSVAISRKKRLLTVFYFVHLPEGAIGKEPGVQLWCVYLMATVKKAFALSFRHAFACHLPPQGGLAFCSKSVRPKVLISLRIRKSCNYNRALPIYH